VDPLPIECDVYAIPLVKHLDLPKGFGDEVLDFKITIHDKAKRWELTRSYYCISVISPPWRSGHTIADRFQFLEMLDYRLQAQRLHASKAGTDSKIKLDSGSNRIRLLFVKRNWIICSLNNMSTPHSE